MGIHVGPAEQRDGDYYGAAVNLAARLMSVAHGGQIVVSLATEELAVGQLPSEVELLDLGRAPSARPRSARACFPGRPSRAAPAVSAPSLARTRREGTCRCSRRARSSVVSATWSRSRSSLRECPVVTLVGVGGVGKTRLALQVARRSVPRIPRRRVVRAAWPRWATKRCSTRRWPPPSKSYPGPVRLSRETVFDHVRDKRMLVVLDNCEHLVGAVDALLEGALGVAPDLRVLATSREGLGVAGERSFRTGAHRTGPRCRRRRPPAARRGRALRRSRRRGGRHASSLHR